MREKPKGTVRTAIVKFQDPFEMHTRVNKVLERLQEDGCEIINASHGAGIGHGRGQYGSGTREVYSTLILYRESLTAYSKRIKKNEGLT